MHPVPEVCRFCFRVATVTCRFAPRVVIEEVGIGPSRERRMVQGNGNVGFIFVWVGLPLKGPAKVFPRGHRSRMAVEIVDCSAAVFGCKDIQVLGDPSETGIVSIVYSLF